MSNRTLTLTGSNSVNDDVNGTIDSGMDLFISFFEGLVGIAGLSCGSSIW